MNEFKRQEVRTPGDTGEWDGNLPQGTPPNQPTRRGSVTFREAGDATDAASMLDPANQSLAEALNILLKLLYVGVAALFVAYLISGFKFVKEGERGIRLLFGRVEDSSLEPGFRWGPPFPFGDIVTVSSGVNSVAIEKEYWPYDGGSDKKSIENIAPTPSLKPNQGGSGSIITGDGNLVHARWSAQYRKQNAKLFAENVMPNEEEMLVRMAIGRGVVRACAEVPIDQMLRTSAESQGSIASRAKAIAQDALDQAKSGIMIESLSLTDVTPPLYVRQDFAKTQSAAANAEKVKENATSARTGVLNATAGDVSDLLIQKIDAYELALSKSDSKGAEALLTEIDSVLEGKGVEIDGTTKHASGSVTKLVSDAKTYRDQVVNQAMRDVERFEALLKQFRANPLVMVNTQWTNAVSAFYKRPSVTTMYLPQGRDGDLVQILLNRDPFAMRDLDRLRKEDEAKRAAAIRAELNKKSQFQTDINQPLNAQ